MRKGKKKRREAALPERLVVCHPSAPSRLLGWHASGAKARRFLFVRWRTGAERLLRTGHTAEDIRQKWYNSILNGQPPSPNWSLRPCGKKKKKPTAHPCFYHPMHTHALKYTFVHNVVGYSRCTPSIPQLSLYVDTLTLIMILSQHC